tara:strand:+ start:41 stop:295 length:255 start_codon:yes stop_codon:yes gene_type:complete
MRVEAKNPKNQSRVNRAMKHLEKYNILNDERDCIENSLDVDDIEDNKDWKRVNKRCEDVWDKFLTALEELPKGEQNRITKSELY